MPTLPLNAAEPMTAVLGVMLFPADEDAAVRDCWEALTLAPMLVQLRSQGAIIEDSLLDWILAHCGPFSVDQEDLADRRTGGIVTGELVTVLHWLTLNHPNIASWSKAIDWLQVNRKGFTRSAIYKHKARFRSVRVID
jgi:hypothetical protein